MRVYGIGSIIAYTPFGGGFRYIKVLEKEEDIKNGRPGFSGVSVHQEDGKWVEDTSNYWGYDSQITSVLVLQQLEVFA